MVGAPPIKAGPAAREDLERDGVRLNRIEDSHVWMPPFVQEVFERFDRVIGRGHVSGLFVRPDLAAGRYGDARILRRSNHRALSSLGIHAFLDPDLTDQLTLPFGDLLTRPTLPRLLELI